MKSFEKQENTHTGADSSSVNNIPLLSDYQHYTCEVSSIQDENPFSLSPKTVEKESALVTLTFDLMTPKSIDHLSAIDIIYVKFHQTRIKTLSVRVRK